MKYRLKKAQGSIPANTIFTNYEGYIEVFNEDNQTIIYYDIKDIPLLIEQGIIEEFKELKWSDEDMVGYAKLIIKEYYRETFYEGTFRDMLKKYKSEQNKE